MIDRTVLAAVIKRDERFLLCRRPLHKHHGGLWEFPGGKVEPGETLEDSARRELKEELDLEVLSIGETALIVVDDSSGYSVCFVPVEVAGEPKLIEHTQINWVCESDLAELDLAPSDRIFSEHMRSRGRLEA